MWELDCEEGWALKNCCFWTVVLEKTLESPLDCKEIQPVHSEGDQLWAFFGRNDAKAEAPVLWPPHVKSWLIGKDTDPGRDWGQEEKGMTEDDMAGWHHGLDGRESEWSLRVGDGQGGLACCDSWGHKESDTTEWLNWTELNWEYGGVEKAPELSGKLKNLILQRECDQVRLHGIRPSKSTNLPVWVLFQGPDYLWWGHWMPQKKNKKLSQYASCRQSISW